MFSLDIGMMSEFVVRPTISAFTTMPNFIGNFTEAVDQGDYCRQGENLVAIF